MVRRNSQYWIYRTSMNGSGLCECGCGLPAPIATHTRRELNHVKGYPVKFIRGHRARLQVRNKYDDERSLANEQATTKCACGCGNVVLPFVWYPNKQRMIANKCRFTSKAHASRATSRSRIQERIIQHGYVFIRNEDHPRARGGRIQEHIVIAELALGYYLPYRAVVHHVNGDTKDNSNSNLVICEDQAYHLTLHGRLDALRASGNADFLRCVYCHIHDAKSNLTVSNSRRSHHAYHSTCRNEFYKKKKEKE